MLRQNLKPTRLWFISAPFETEFLGYGGEPTSLLYALAPLVDEIKQRRLPSLDLSDISVVSFRSGAEVDFKELLKALEQAPPQLLGISNMSPSSPIARQIAELVKGVSPDTITIFGGPHEDEMIEGNHVRLELVDLASGPRYVTKSTALTHPGIADFSVSGDGEFALLYIVRQLLELQSTNGGLATPASLKERVESGAAEVAVLPGVGEISFVTNDREVHLNLSGKPLDLNRLPFMPRELLSDEYSRTFSIFRQDGKNRRTAQLMTQRGCAWTCAFCTEGTSKRTARTFENVRREIETFRELGYGAIFFDDSTFTDLVNAHNARGIEGLQRRYFLSDQLLPYLKQEKWEWGCETRIDQVNEQVLREMKDAGCTYIYFGIESVNDRLLRDMHKGQKKSRVIETLDLIESLEMRIGLSLMFCAPNRKTNETVESEDTFEDTIDFFLSRVARGHIEIISTNIATYYPGSVMTRMALQTGVKLDFLNPTPNRGYPWNRFEDGLGHHPPNVTRSFVNEIVNGTARKLSLYLLKGNIQATTDSLYDSLVRPTRLINLNHAAEFAGSAGSSLGMQPPFEKGRLLLPEESHDTSMAKGRKLFARLLRLPDDGKNVVFARTAPEAVALALAMTGCYSPQDPASAVVVARDSRSILRPFQKKGDHGNPAGAAGDALPQILESSFFSYPPFVGGSSGMPIALVHQFDSDIRMESQILRRIIGRQKTVVLLPHVAPDTGQIMDIVRICDAIREEQSDEQEDAIIIVDGRMGALALPSDDILGRCDYDFYVASPVESLGIPSCAALVMSDKQAKRLAKAGFWTTDVPVLQGMFHKALPVQPNVKDVFPQEMVQNFTGVIAEFEELLKNNDILGAISLHRRKLKAQLYDLLREKFRLKAWSAPVDGFSDFIASFRLEGLDHFGLTEYLWREQQLLGSYFCEPDVMRFSFDLNTKFGEIQDAVQRIERIAQRFAIGTDMKKAVHTA